VLIESPTTRKPLMCTFFFRLCRALLSKQETKLQRSYCLSLNSSKSNDVAVLLSSRLRFFFCALSVI
jgi:hypothetical protein